MLVNLEFDPERSIWEGLEEKFLEDMDERTRALKEKDILVKLADGIYEYWDCNPIILPRYKIHHDIDDENGRFIGLLPYGVADNYKQILERDYEVRQYINDPNKKYILQLHYISKASQPDWGGWRWHKWGTYIGDFEPKNEYLYDEEGIDGVFVYNICEVIKQ